MKPTARQILCAAFAVSIAAHAAVLSVRFAAADPVRAAETQKPIEVMLVNAYTRTRPPEPDALAQANLDGGGTHEAGTATSPLPASDVALDGNASRTARKKLSRLEDEQKELLAALDNLRTRRRKAAMVPTEQSGSERADAASADEDEDILTRRAARIEKEISDWQKRPRRHIFAPSTSAYRFARYVEQWCQQVERVGSEHFPVYNRSRLYGRLRMRVVVDANGLVQEARVTRSSGNRVLDKAALVIVRQAAPYAPFPPDIARDTSSIEITRNWSFTRHGMAAAFPRK